MLAGVLRSFRGSLRNAHSTRDFRTQLRTNKAMWAWIGYLLTMILFAMIYYSQAAQVLGGSVTEAQMRLANFYRTTLGFLVFVMLVIAPILATTSISTDFKRGAIDLIGVSPRSKLYYLAGKIRSGYRYVWTLLGLSLPLTATCVVLGGATWTDVLLAYVTLSAHALIYMSITLFVPIIAKNAIPTVLVSYAIIGCYALPFLGFGTAAMFGGMGPMGATREAPYVLLLSPIAPLGLIDTITFIGPLEVPNVILLIVTALAIYRFGLVAAASAMDPMRSATGRELRIWVFVIFAVLSFVGARVSTTLFAGFVGAPPASASDDAEAIAGMMMLTWLPLICTSTFAPLAERKHWPDRLWSLRGVWDGTTSGGLPLQIIYSVCVLVFFALGLLTAGGALSVELLLGWLSGVAAMLMVFAVGRLASGWSLGDLRSSRLLTIALVAAVLIFPYALLGIVETVTNSQDHYVLHPFAASSLTPLSSLAMGTAYAWLWALGLMWLGERRTKRAISMVALEELNDG